MFRVIHTIRLLEPWYIYLEFKCLGCNLNCFLGVSEVLNWTKNEILPTSNFNGTRDTEYYSYHKKCAMDDVLSVSRFGLALRR